MAEIKQGKFIDSTGQEKDVVFIGAEKAIFDDEGTRLDEKLKEREKASGLLITDTQGVVGEQSKEIDMQTLIDAIAEKVMNQLIAKTMMSNIQVDDESKVPTSALAYSMNQAIEKNASDIAQLNSELAQTLDSPYAFKGKIYLYRLGNIKKIYIDGFKDVPVGQTTVIGTIPKDYLPIMADYSWDKSNVSDQPYRVGLLRNGSLTIHVYTSNFSGENNTIFDEVYF